MVVCLKTTGRVLAERRLQQTAAELELRTAEVERALAETATAERRLRDVFAQAPVGVAVLAGPTLTYEIANARYQEVIGGGRPLLGVPVRAAFPEVAGQGYFERLEQVYATGTPVSLPESRVLLDRDRDGVAEEYFYDLRFVALRDASGAVYAVVIIAAEVTEQVRVRRALESMHARLELALRAGALGAWELDLVTETLEASPSCKAIFGRPAAAPFTYAGLLGAIHPDDRPRVRAAIAAALGDGCEYDAEFRATLPDGREHWIAARGRVTRDVDAGPDAVRLHGRDTGIGIAADKLDAIFEPLVQVRGDFTRTAEGTGLGLAISRDLARGMGGDLTAT